MSAERGARRPARVTPAILAQPEGPAEDAGEGVPSVGGDVSGGAAAQEREEKPSAEDRAARNAVRGEPGKGEEPTRVQDPQAKDAPGVEQESGEKKDPHAPETGRGGASGTSEREDGS